MSDPTTRHSILRKQESGFDNVAFGFEDGGNEIMYDSWRRQQVNAMLSTNAEVYTNTSGQQLRTKTLRKVEHLTHLGRHDGCAKYQRHLGNASGVVKSVIDERKEGIQTLKKTDSTPVSQTRSVTEFRRRIITGRGFHDLKQKRSASKNDQQLQETYRL